MKRTEVFNTPAAKRDTWFIYFVLGVSILLSLVILLDLSPLVRGPREWRWGLLPWPNMGLILASTGTVALFLAVWYVIGRRLPVEPRRPRIWMSLIVLVTLTIIVQIGFLLLYRPNPIITLFDRSASNRASGYYSVAQEIEDVSDFLSRFPERMPTFTSSSHVQTKPPGILLIYWSAGRIMDQLPWLSSPIAGWARNSSAAGNLLADQADAAIASNALVSTLTPLLSAMAILPAFGFASRRWGSMAGWIAAGLVALIPARFAFAPQMDTLYVLLSVTALYLVDTGLLRGQPVWSFAAGILLSIATFMSPVNLVVLALLGLYILFAFVMQNKSTGELKTLALHLVALIVGGLGIWLIYWLFFGVSMLDFVRAIDSGHLPLWRSYWFWLAGNLVDFLLLAGLPVLVLAASWPFLKRHSKLPEAVGALALSFWATLLLLDFSGIIRAETGRIWLMLAPFPAILAGSWLVYVFFEPGISGSLHRIRTLRGGLVILASTAMMTLAIGIRWNVLILEWPAP